MNDRLLRKAYSFQRRMLLVLPILAFSILAGCAAPQVSQSQEKISVPVTVDGSTKEISLQAGTSVENALKAAGVTLGNLDQVTPALYTILNKGDAIQVVRIREEFVTTQEIIPFERQTVRTELLPDGQTRISQPGENGLRELTSRRLFKDGVDSGEKTVVKTVVLTQPVPEIVLIGAQSPFTPLQIPGKLAYLSGGNAWVMDGSTANRQPVVTSGDLDGRVFSLSPDGQWLLYTRKSIKSADEEINTLWVMNIVEAGSKPIDLKVSNIIHYASFVPSLRQTIAYSTVEPRSTAPGWQANNDLEFRKFSASGAVGEPAEVITANAGGVYGWWGTNYIWSQDGKQLAYSRPDGIGLVDIKQNSLNPLLENVPYQSGSDWTLIPGLAWGADGDSIFTVTHAPPPAQVKPEESPYFDLSAVSLVNSTNVAVAEQTGMFAYPSASSMRAEGDQQTYKIAYLQAIFPDQSATSRYRLMVMDSDGSNRSVIFPPEGSAGLAPQTPVWAPSMLEGAQGDYLAFIYQGNLWLVDAGSGKTQQVTGDGLASKIDWK
jgi:resuscitation-promoting factor RpfB